MKLSTGKVAFPIEFDNGDKDCIYFNPNDPDLAARLIASKDKIQKRIEELKFDDFEIANDGEAVSIDNVNDIENLTDEQLDVMYRNADKLAKSLNDTRDIVCEELDYAFGSDISTVVFKHCSPFAVVGGKYFIMAFLEAIVPEIQKHVEKSNKSADQRTAKYIKKYLK